MREEEEEEGEPELIIKKVQEIVENIFDIIDNQRWYDAWHIDRMGKSINKQKTPDNDDNYGLNYYIENYMKKDISKERSSDLEGAALEEQIIKAKNKLYNNGVVEPNSGIGDGKDIIGKIIFIRRTTTYRRHRVT